MKVVMVGAPNLIGITRINFCGEGIICYDDADEIHIPIGLVDHILSDPPTDEGVSQNE